MKFVLHLKHWQLFVLTFALPFFLYMLFIVNAMAAAFTTNPLEAMSSVTIILGALTALAWLMAVVTSISWTFNLATGLYKKLPAGNFMKINRFYFAFFYPAVYLVCCIALMFSVFFMDMNSPNAVDGQQPMSPMFGFVALIIPFHLLAIACIFYIFYFLAKSLKSVEMNRQAFAKDYISEFVMIWFSFIGVWFLQPRVNEIFSEQATPTPAGGPLDSM